jgi:hypothetical protein
MSFENKVLGIYDLVAGPYPPAPSEGDRAIFYSDTWSPYTTGPHTYRNDDILVYTLSPAPSWFNAAPVVPETGETVGVLPSPGASADTLSYIFDLQAPPGYAHPNTHWFPLNVTSDHLTFAVPPWPPYYFAMTNGEGLGGVTHSQIGAWLNQPLKSFDSPTFAGLSLGAMSLRSGNELDIDGSASTGPAPLGAVALVLAWSPPSDGQWTVELVVAAADIAGGGSYSADVVLGLTVTLGSCGPPNMVRFWESKAGTMGAALCGVSVSANTLQVSASGSVLRTFAWRCRASAVAAN